MDLLIILTYVAFAWAMFKIFKIPFQNAISMWRGKIIWRRKPP